MAPAPDLATATPVPAPAPQQGAARPLCVDLDGTLIATDLLWECVLLLLRKRPWEILRAPLWLLKGRAHLKQELARRVQLPVESLPYRGEVLEYIRSERAKGREVVLTTAADASLARRVSEHLGCFTDVLASDGRTNLAGRRKCDALNERYGRGCYSYMGNGAVDFPMWQAASAAILVAPSPRLLARVRRLMPVEVVFPRRSPGLRTYLEAVRAHQWVKNLLIFVPVLLDHRLLDFQVLGAAALAFTAFSLAASGGYVLNDLLDMGADRRHPVKRARPFAAGSLSPTVGVGLVPPLFLGATALALFTLPARFVFLLAIYLVATIAYSLYLKRIAVLDVVILAGLYTLRILAGIAATDVRFSEWLLAFSMFLFLSLAFMKRYGELKKSGAAEGDKVARRGYAGEDLDWLRSMGGSSGYLAVLVLALYISSDEVTSLYTRPMTLWLICPLLLFWISRMWFRAHRGKVAEDPILATARDPVSYAVGALLAAVMIAAL